MSKLKLTTLANQDDSASVPADTIVSGTAKAWVNFNGTGTVAIRRAFNVSSVTDNGVGDYTVNFTTAMVDTNYSISMTIGGTASAYMSRDFSDGTARTTSSIRVSTINTSVAVVDPAQVSVTIFS